MVQTRSTTLGDRQKLEELYNQNPLSTEVIRELKSVWRAITGYQSDPPWYTFRQALESNGLLSAANTHEQNLQNVRRIAKLQKELPKTGIPLKDAVRFYLEIEQTINNLNGRKIPGRELVDLIKQQGIPLPVSTRGDWFKHLGGYQSKREYYPDQTAYILFRCSIYLAKQARKSQSNK
jgi:hypothetical protein